MEKYNNIDYIKDNLINLLRNKGCPSEKFQEEFLEWFYSFPDYKDENQGYGLNNEKHINFKNHQNYFYIKIKERVIIEILRELNPKNKYILSTDYDDFSYGIDCLEIDKEGKIKGIDLTTNTNKEIINIYIKPIDFLRNPNTSIEIRKKGIKREVYYFDDNAINHLVKSFIKFMINGKGNFSFFDTYKSKVSKDSIKFAKDNVKNGIITIL